MVCKAECKSPQPSKTKSGTEKRAKKLKGKRHKAGSTEMLESGRASASAERKEGLPHGGGSVNDAPEIGRDLERLQAELARIRERRAQLYEEETKVFEQLRSLVATMTP
jgi:hypothetical protein